MEITEQAIDKHIIWAFLPKRKRKCPLSQTTTDIATQCPHSDTYYRQTGVRTLTRFCLRSASRRDLRQESSSLWRATAVESSTPLKSVQVAYVLSHSLFACARYCVSNAHVVHQAVYLRASGMCSWLTSWTSLKLCESLLTCVFLVLSFLSCFKLFGKEYSYHAHGG